MESKTTLGFVKRLLLLSVDGWGERGWKGKGMRGRKRRG